MVFPIEKLAAPEKREFEPPAEGPPRNDEMMVSEIGRVGGFAPGSYICNCGSCDRPFIGDKRARQCLPCVVGVLVKYIETS